jgi:maleamate amidohydrolase
VVTESPADPSTIWAPLLGPGDRETVARAQFARRSGFGQYPAILVIDAQNYMIGPVGDERDDYVSSCGAQGRAAVGRIALLLAVARAAGAPVIYTRYEVAADGSDMGAYRRKRNLIKSHTWCLSGTFGAQIADAIKPEPGDLVLVKKKPSAFLGTPLLGHLIDRQIDTVVVVGGSTSNCVRATAVDAVSYNYRVLVPADCVFDRIAISHAVALFDLDRQYGDVVWAGDVESRLRGEREPR